MAEGDVGDRTFTQEEVDALVAERNASLAANQERLMDEAKEAKRKLDAFAGIDPEKARQAEARLAELEQQQGAEKAGITSEQLDKLRADVRAEVEKEYAPLKTQVDELANDNRTLRLVDKVQALMAEQGVIGSKVSALYTLEGSAFDLTDDGKPMLKDNPGGDIGKFVSDTLSKKYPEWFEGSGSSGGGAARTVPGGQVRKGKVAAEDSDAFMDNVEDIAKGVVEVVS